EELGARAAPRVMELPVGHQARGAAARAGLFDHRDPPLVIDCVRTGPWTGRGTDVSVVLDLMIHDLDIMHRLVPGRVLNARARGRSVKGMMRDEVAATVFFDGGTEARLLASRSSEIRRRSLRAAYRDGEIEIDFLTREIHNTTGRPLRPLDMDDPLAESVADFVAAVRAGKSPMVRPDEALQALETALLIEEASEPAQHGHTLDEMAAYA
ncbi:MAG: Gfo/Idh/MocA family protein, partial [Alphaproteobacteria bacterium]